MPVTITWVGSSSSRQEARGHLWPSSAGSSRRPVIVPWTGSCWPVCQPSNTSGTCWRGRSSSYGPTTSCSPMLSTGYQTPGQLGSSITWPTWLSTPHRFAAGADNVVADTLSRMLAVADQPPAVGAVVPPASTGPLNWTALAAEQATCEQLLQLQKSSSLQIQQVSLQDVPVWCDVAMGAIRPLVPRRHRRAVFDNIHSLAHPGTRATTRLISSRFVWPGLATDVKEWCRECVAYQRAKVTTQPSTPVEKISIPEQLFSHKHVDLVGPWPTACAGYRYLLTVIDRSTQVARLLPFRRSQLRQCWTVMSAAGYRDSACLPT